VPNPEQALIPLTQHDKCRSYSNIFLIRVVIFHHSVMNWNKIIESLTISANRAYTFIAPKPEVFTFTLRYLVSGDSMEQLIPTLRLKGSGKVVREEFMSTLKVICINIVSSMDRILCSIYWQNTLLVSPRNENRVLCKKWQLMS
jgi:hypothetical protein